MARLMDPLRDEHATLLPHIEGLLVAANAVGFVAVDDLRTPVDDSFRFLVQHLIPHATAEDRELYPSVQGVMGSAQATATMSRDHAEVAQLTHELGEMRDRLSERTGVPNELARELRRVLYGLYALVKVHFAKEEEIYLPLLEANLAPVEATQLFERMEAATDSARRDSS